MNRLLTEARREAKFHEHQTDVLRAEFRGYRDAVRDIMSHLRAVPR